VRRRAPQAGTVAHDGPVVPPRAVVAVVAAGAVAGVLLSRRARR
jgi:hypothetical protein